MAKFGNKGVMLAIGVLIFALLVSLLLPTAINAFNEPQSNSITQNESETYEVTANLESNATKINSSHVEVTLNDTAANTQKSATIAENNNKTLSMPDGDVNITVNSIETSGTNSSELSYDYPQTYNWNNGSGQLFNIIPLLFVLVVLFFAVRTAQKEL